MTDRIDQVEGVLLCGAGGRGLGFPVEMLRVDGAPLAVRMVERLRQVFARVSVVSDRPAFLQYCLDVPIRPYEFEEGGALAGLQSALKQAALGRCFILGCDMPLVHTGIVRQIAARAAQSGRLAVIASAAGKRQPLCGVYDVRLVPLLETALSRQDGTSLDGFLNLVELETVDIGPSEAPCFRRIDAPQDIRILGEVFADVEPLPVSTVAVRSRRLSSDAVMEEWAVAVHVNTLKLVTVMCLPNALRELAVGFAAYLGLVRDCDSIRALQVDYEARRAMLELPVADDEIRRAAMLLVTSTCGANVYGAELPAITEQEPGELRVTRTHILECIRALRPMGPVFSATGGTHNAAFSDGTGVQLFFEDIGRHNAVDKVIGRAILDGRPLSRGLLVSTGRLSSEMVVKALRQKVPVLAAPSAVTTNAIQMAQARGLTLVGFARGGRVNVYAGADRVEDA